MRKKQISTVLLVVMVFAIASLMTGNAQASPQTILEVYPETTIVDLGETFTVYVNITDVVDLAGYEFKLGYSPYILEVVDATNGTFFDFAWIYLDCVYTGQPTDDADVVQDGILDIYDEVFIASHWYNPPYIIGPCGYDPRADLNDDGLVDIVDAGIFSLALGNTYAGMSGTIFCRYRHPIFIPESGSGSLVTITFRAIGFGETVLDLYDTKLSPICGEQPIPHGVIDGTVTVLVPPGQEEEAMQSLATTIESWNLDGGTENSLTTKLEAAIHLFNQNNLNGAVHKVEDFINKVEAMRNKKLTDEQADYLVSSAQAIINAIG